MKLLTTALIAALSTTPVFAKTTDENQAVTVTINSEKEEKKSKSEGISRLGKPKRSADFKHFEYVNPTAPKGGHFKLATIGTFDTLNLFTIKGIPDQNLMVVHDSLMRRAVDEPFTLYPLIAERVEIASDSSELTIHLNPKARFHDGTPITAEDVQFTYEKLISEGLPRYKQFYGKIDSYKIIDTHTIKLTLKKDEERNEYNPETPYILCLAKVLSKKSLEGQDLRETGLKPILGTGPYRIKKSEPGRAIVYERVKDYWAKDLPVNVGHYNFDEITIYYFKNATTMTESFKAGEFDVMFEADQKQWRTAYSFPAVHKGHVKLVAEQHKRPVAVRTAIFNMRRPLFADVRVRKALTLAFDWETLNKMAFNNAYLRMNSLFANTFLAHCGAPKDRELELLTPYKDRLPKEAFEKGFCLPEHSPATQRKVLEEANALLTEAGWLVKDGKRVNAQGQPLKFEFLLKDPRMEKLALSYRETLKKIGVDLVVRLVDTVQYEDRAVKRDFDMIAHTWSNSLSPGNEQVYYFSKKMADVDGSSNYIGMKDEMLEKLAEEVSASKTREDLEAAVHALDRACLYSYYMIPVYYENTTYWAYWDDRVSFPKFNPEAGTNAIDWWWSKKAVS